MTAGNVVVDYTNWDWLPKAAEEIHAYLDRLLVEAAIDAHAIAARAKSISSFDAKCKRKGYADPVAEVTDTVAVRVITYSVTDRNRVAELIRDRFVVKDGEDRCPGDVYPTDRRGYDCQHLVVTGEKTDLGPGWLVSGGKLSQYFERFGGLEIQIRTVAAHAWAEFEHDRRYKGAQYNRLGDHDQSTIDRLFGAAADARRALDEVFDAIDRLLANPTLGEGEIERPDDSDLEDVDTAEFTTPISVESIRRFLEDRYRDDEPASEAGVEFACELVSACGIETTERLQLVLETVDSEEIRSLMSIDRAVTRVRRLDDDLLARYGARYIEMTGDIGRVATRRRQLEWRFDRLRGKTRYSMYAIQGTDCPDDLRTLLLPAARAVREVARAVADTLGADTVTIDDAVSTSNDLPSRVRAKKVTLANGESIWVATNLARDYSEQLLRQLLGRAEGRMDLEVLKDGQAI